MEVCRTGYNCIKLNKAVDIPGLIHFTQCYHSFTQVGDIFLVNPDHSPLSGSIAVISLVSHVNYFEYTYNSFRCNRNWTNNASILKVFCYANKSKIKFIF